MRKNLMIIGIILFVVTGCGLFIKDNNLSNYLGSWGNNDSSIPDFELYIEKITDDEIVFDYYLYRLTSFESIKATLDGNKAVFDKKNDLDWEIKGDIVLKNNKVFLNINYSSSDLINEGTVEFKYKEDKIRIKNNNLPLD